LGKRASVPGLSQQQAAAVGERQTALERVKHLG
jgi:hypothetical protein